MIINLKIKLSILVVSVLLSIVIDYALFIPAGIANLLISIFVTDYRVITLFDLILSNLIFLGVFQGISFLVNKLRAR